MSNLPNQLVCPKCRNDNARMIECIRATVQGHYGKNLKVRETFLCVVCAREWWEERIVEAATYVK